MFLTLVAVAKGHAVGREAGVSEVHAMMPFYTQRILSYRRETALQGALVLAKSGRLERGDNISRTFYNNCHEFGKKNAK